MKSYVEMLIEKIAVIEKVSVETVRAELDNAAVFTGMNTEQMLERCIELSAEQ